MAHYDLIVIVTGPGGASLAQRLAPTGKRILILERGDYLPRTEKNWSSQAVFVDGIYQTRETWTNAKGDTFSPALHYYVGGNSKVYGAALFRLRQRDFGEVIHAGGISPAWPLGYDVFEPYYMAAEKLFHVHGQRGEDPLEPWTSGPYPHPPVSHEPKIAELSSNLRGIGLNLFHLPLGILLDGKADAQVICVDPMLAAHPNVTLLTGAYVSQLGTDALGRTVDAVHVTRIGQEKVYSADIVVVACGALSSALLLLRSANDKHPNGLANGSHQVGRNYMRHDMSVLMAVMKDVNDTVFQKTMAFTDFYFGADDFDYPLGLVQICATSHSEQIKAEALASWLEWLPDMPFDVMARHSMDFWLQSEDLPHPDNRIYYKDGKVHLDLVETNPQALAHLKRKLKEVLDPRRPQRGAARTLALLRQGHPARRHRAPGRHCALRHRPGDLRARPGLQSTRVGHLYVADASFSSSIGAVNPTLTIIANALRVADRITERLK